MSKGTETVRDIEDLESKGKMQEEGKTKETKRPFLPIPKASLTKFIKLHAGKENLIMSSQYKECLADCMINFMFYLLDATKHTARDKRGKTSMKMEDVVNALKEMGMGKIADEMEEVRRQIIEEKGKMKKKTMAGV